MGVLRLVRGALAFVAGAAIAPTAACISGASAAVVLNGLTTYEQDFDFLADNNSFVEWDDDAAVESVNGSPGWLWQFHTSEPSLFFYNAGTPTNNLGRAHALGVGDQAMGNLNGDFVLATTWGVVFQNNTGQTISEISVSYVGEQWRRATMADSLIFSYQTSPMLITELTPSQASPAGWISFASLDFQTPDVGTNRFQLDGNDAANSDPRTGTLPITLPNGQYVALRWYDADAALRTGAALGIDDLSVSFTAASVPEKSAWLFGVMVTLATTARLAWRQLAQRRSVGRQ